MKKIIILTIIGGLISLGIGYYFGINNTVKSTPEETKITKKENKEVVLEKKTTAIKPKIAVLPKRVEKKKEVYVTAEKETYDTSFELTSIEENKAKYEPKKGVEPITSFKMKQNTIKNLRPGDKLVLPEINGIEYELNVKNIKVNDDKSVTVTSNLDGEDKKYYSIMTEGEKYSFMTIKSPEGVFEVEVYKENGYIYSSKTISNTYKDYTKTDGLRPATK